MVKYGKLYRELQIIEFKGNYIDYKKLKQKIKQINEYLYSQFSGILSANTVSTKSLKINLYSSIKDEEYTPTDTKYIVKEDKYNEKLVEFKNLLDEEIKRCYKFFQRMIKQLHNKINGHLYTQTNYSSYNKEDIIKEINNLKNTIYLAKCLNAFIHDNMMAIKKILKKFDKKFNMYFGNLAPKYILDNLCKQNSDLEDLLEFKVIDEVCCIIESNIYLLRDYYMELNQEIKIKKEEDEFFLNYNKIWEYLIEIDELIYFKIQYKEWFYFIKKNAVMKKQSNLYKNLMFNPILFSAYHKDDIMNKFLPRKEQIKEIEDIQIPLSVSNQVNLLIILIQTFFYNTLISGIYPLQFIYLKDIQDNWGKKYSLTEYSFLIISSTYICSYFSIMIYHLFGTKRIKLSYMFCNIFFFLGSLFYIISYNDKKDVNYVFTFLITARIFIGFGANPLMGKKYILLYAPKYFLPKISKYYVFASILGHSMGPLVVFLFFLVSAENEKEVFPNFFYSQYNSIGWYGIILSLFLIIFDIYFFTSPTSKGFKKLQMKNLKNDTENDKQGKSQVIIEEDDSNEYKEFYQVQKEMIDKSDALIEISDNINNNTQQLEDPEYKIEIKDKDKKDNINKAVNEDDEDNTIRNTNTFNGTSIDNFNAFINLNYKQNPLTLKEKEEENDEENNLDVSEHGNFVNIDMIPRTITDLLRKEKIKFSYLNRNLLIILIILFFCNLLKENFIAYSSYYLYNQNKDNNKLGIFSSTYLCLFISISYFLEMFSMFFILPLYKINTKLKKFLVILMLLSIILMIPICFEIKLYYYFIIISIVILISAIIEVLSSAYLAYLTPPDWQIFHINAGSLPFYIMNFGKLFGCLICFTSLAEKNFVHHLNNFVILIITIIGYGISGFYIFKSKNFRIKAICRIMRKTELDSFNF